MKSFSLVFCLILINFALTSYASVYDEPLSMKESERGSSMYQRYCSLCHGENREGNAADHAPSLRSKSLMSTAPTAYLSIAVEYGRPGTAMSGYLDEIGGPLSLEDITILVKWLKEKADTKNIEFSEKIIKGNVRKGEKVYKENCASCHGSQGKGVTAPALSNKSFLSYATDEFIEYAIVNGRDGTAMQAFGEKLESSEVNNLVAYIRSNATDWSPSSVKLGKKPTIKDYVLNPDGPNPRPTLKDGRYIMMADLNSMIEDKNRFVLLDTRTSSEWHNLHIPGAIPMPYYISEQDVDLGLPRDGTWIIAYCSCPRAASDKIIDMLRKKGFQNTAVLYDGIFAWINNGMPVTTGNVSETSTN